MATTIEEFKDLKEKILSSDKMFFARVPKRTKKEFIEFANGEFAEDYGMCLHFIWEAFKHYQQIINTQDTKLDYMIQLLKSQNTQSNVEAAKPQFLSPKKEVTEI